MMSKDYGNAVLSFKLNVKLTLAWCAMQEDLEIGCFRQNQQRNQV